MASDGFTARGLPGGGTWFKHGGGDRHFSDRHVPEGHQRLSATCACSRTRKGGTTAAAAGADVGAGGRGVVAEYVAVLMQDVGLLNTSLDTSGRR